MSANSYFNSMAREHALLRRHGLDRMPSESELVFRLLEHEEALSALCSHLGLQPRKDARNHWMVVPREVG